MDQKVVRVIEEPAELLTFCQQLQKEAWIAIDTEFIREKTFHSQLCLIQVATEAYAACIDPIKIKDLQPFLDILNNQDIIKIFHSAVQDVEIFYHLCGKVPSPLFDTQLAMPLLGEQDFMGYGSMVKSILGVSLSKSHTRTDWAQRPLHKAQLEYAIDDVIYLAQIYPILIKKLTGYGRLAWLEPEFKHLESGEIFKNPVSKIWDKYPVIRQFSAPKVSIIQHLLAWREKTIREVDIPRKWFLSDHDIVDIAKQQPSHFDELQLNRAIPRQTLKKHGKMMLSIIEYAKTQKPEALPPSKRKAKLSANQKMMLELLNALVNIRAHELKISAAVLAPTQEVNLLLTQPESSALLKGWRKALIGEPLLELLEGRVTMKIVNHKVVLELQK